MCIHSSCPEDLLRFLHFFHVASDSCGLITSPEKSRVLAFRPVRTLPEFIIGKRVIPLSNQYL